MHINLEASDRHTIQAYNENEVKINSLVYQNSLIVSNQEIITDWPVSTIHDLNHESLLFLLKYQPRIILLGHKTREYFAPMPVVQSLARQQIALEVMSIGAACRTFNVLLSEQREVVLGIIL
ncbi:MULTISPECIES: Mth938-like domain-containing protein [unclassified Legionella]|uniref:Mth938-like domain-containing protein n=1 Tax=unclassified Legionella TaxID=2622702 RepID=UPI001056788A|nr:MULTISPECIES: MTH938/NDUFAF3 family protein [unclassified Legionella]MDI9818824.1 MTH938/NDUFAF3 family protein [Legionella sp. PL877]